MVQVNISDSLMCGFEGTLKKTCRAGNGFTGFLLCKNFNNYSWNVISCYIPEYKNIILQCN